MLPFWPTLLLEFARSSSWNLLHDSTLLTCSVLWVSAEVFLSSRHPSLHLKQRFANNRMHLSSVAGFFARTALFSPSGRNSRCYSNCCNRSALVHDEAAISWRKESENWEYVNCLFFRKTKTTTRLKNRCNGLRCQVKKCSIYLKSNAMHLVVDLSAACYFATATFRLASWLDDGSCWLFGRNYCQSLLPALPVTFGGAFLASAPLLAGSAGQGSSQILLVSLGGFLRLLGIGISCQYGVQVLLGSC